MRYEVEVSSKARSDLVDITALVQDCVRRSGIDKGICCLFVPHTTAGLTVNENWDPSVKDDILMVLDRLVPWHGSYHHGEGNAAAHVKASILGSSQTLAVQGGSLVLGTWQGVYLAEFDGPRRRRVLIRLIRETQEA